MKYPHISPLVMAGLWLGAAAHAAAPGSGQGDVAVTIYNNGQSLVQDDRQLSVNPGRNRIEFPDVSAQIRPETVTLSGSVPSMNAPICPSRFTSSSPPRATAPPDITMLREPQVPVE